MDIHNTSIHIMIGQNTIRHICYFLDLSKTVKGNFTVDPFVAFLCPGLMPRGLYKSRRHCIYPDPRGSNSLTSDFVRKCTPYTTDEEYACCPA